MEPRQLFTATPVFATDSAAVASVRVSDGSVRVDATDLTSDGFGAAWGVSRSWTDAASGYLRVAGRTSPTTGGYFGSRWDVDQQPIIRSASGYVAGAATPSLIVTTGATTLAAFEQVSGTSTAPVYATLAAGQNTLAYDASVDRYTMTDPAGNRTTFYGFGSGTSTQIRGTLFSYSPASGATVSVTAHDANGFITQEQRSQSVNGTTVTEELDFTLTGFWSSESPDYLVTGVTLSRSASTGAAFTTVRQVSYGYVVHGDPDPESPLPPDFDLQTATVKDGAGNVLSTEYYRYTSDYPARLSYAFDGPAYTRVATAVGDPLLASDSVVAPYATLAFTYDGYGRVITETQAGTGTSSGTVAGQGTTSFSYGSASSNTPGFNSWSYQTTVTAPSGLVTTEFTNAYGQTILSVATDGTDTWRTYTYYDAYGNVEAVAQPSAVTGYDTALADLVGTGTGSTPYPYLSSTSGLIQITRHFGDDAAWGVADPNATVAATTAGETTPGAGPAWAVQNTQVLVGTAGTAVVTASVDYYAHTVGSATVYPAADTIAYRTAGSAGDTTHYAYTWQNDSSSNPTFAVATLTTTLPTITSAQNGPGVADVTTVAYDVNGNAQWTRDGAGYLTYTLFDVATGGLLRSIADVNTTATSDFTNLPSAWSTPSGGGLELKSTFEVDDQGRTIKQTTPAGRVTYTAYDDVRHAVRSYVGWTQTGTTYAPTGPVQLVWADWTTGRTVTLAYAYTASTASVPTGTEAVANLTALAVDQTDLSGQIVEHDAYRSLSGVVADPAAPTTNAFGSASANYDVTLYGYDAGGWLSQTTDANLTVSQTLHNKLGWTTAAKVGTTTAAMTTVADYTYDADGDLLTQTTHPGGGTADRVTAYGYDGRDRQTSVTTGYGTSGAIVTTTAYDNLGEATGSDQYAGSVATANLRARSVWARDAQGRVYRASATSVNPSNGSTGTVDAADTYYDHRGLVLATVSPTGLASQYTYDGAGRVKADDQGQLTSMTWSAAGGMTSTIVLHQDFYAYDGDGNVIETTGLDRYSTDDPTNPGPLTVTYSEVFEPPVGGDDDAVPRSGTSGITPILLNLARPTVTDAYYDAAGRLTATSAVGTNGYAVWTRPATVPTRSATDLISSYTYDPAGHLATATDPLGLVTAYTYDPLGRTTKTVANYTGTGTPTDSTNQTTAYTYDGDNHVLTMTAVMPSGTPSQTTQYVYGVTASLGIGINDNDLLYEVKYPDPTTGIASAGQAEFYNYDALGERITYADRNGTSHAYGYDVFGHLTSDAATALGTGVDGAVRLLGYTYDDAGRLATATSYSSLLGGAIVNQDVRTYDGFGQLASEAQSVSGAVTSTTPTVGYTHDAAKGDRLTGIVYPDGRTVSYNYGTSGSLTDAAGQITSLSDAGGPIQSYTYLGLDTPVTFADGNGITLSYLAGDGSASDGGDIYTGFDRFGRIVDQDWVNSSGTAVDEFQYKYDADGNVLSKRNTVITTQSEVYTYDGLNRLVTFARGTLNAAGTAITGTASTTESWSLDALGNWNSETLNGTTTSRTNNAQNQLVTVGSATLTYDANGNTLADDAGQQYVYDAWNRLVTVEDPASTTIAAYTYDAKGRRVTETHGSTITALYYSDRWQVLEERLGSTVTAQYTWSPYYVDDMAVRDDHEPTSTGVSLNRRIYDEHDINYNVTSLSDSSATIVERYAYLAYGRTVVEAPSGATRGTGAPFAGLYAWHELFQGRTVEVSGVSYFFRNRVELVDLGRFDRPDPAEYVDGKNRYQFEHSAPIKLVDPLGQTAGDHGEWTPGKGYRLNPGGHNQWSYPDGTEFRGSDNLNVYGDGTYDGSPDPVPIPNPVYNPPALIPGVNYTPPWWENRTVKSTSIIGVCITAPIGGAAGVGARALYALVIYWII